MKLHHLILAILGLGFATSSALGAVAAGAYAELTTIEVRADEFESSAGKAAVIGRIERAAGRVCQKIGVAAQPTNDNCAAQVVARTLRSLDDPRLVAR